MPSRKSCPLVKPNGKKVPCSYDPQLGIRVHRFDLGETTCHCKKVKMPESVEDRIITGWRRIWKSREDNDSKD